MLVRTLQAFCVVMAFAPAVSAQQLQRFDMEKIPLTSFNLEGGSFAVTLFEDKSPFLSQLLIECQDCTRKTDALVGLVADSGGDAADFSRDPEFYLNGLNAICLNQAEACKFTQSTVGGMKGYAYTARYRDGISVVEHTYFSNGLLFVINASGPSLNTAKRNVATLIKVAGPYVTGQKQ